MRTRKRLLIHILTILLGIIPTTAFADREDNWNVLPVENVDDITHILSVSLDIESSFSHGRRGIGYLLNKQTYVVSIADGIVSRVLEYQTPDNAEYQIEIRHQNGFYGIYDGLSTVEVELNQAVSKSARLGLSSNDPQFGPNFNFELLYNGLLINPELLFFNHTNGIDYDNMHEETIRINSEYQGYSNPPLEQTWIDIDGSQFDLEHSVEYFTELLGAPDNVDVSKFEDEGKPEYDLFEYTYQHVQITRFRNSQELNAIVLTGLGAELNSGIGIGAKILDVLAEYGKPMFVSYQTMSCSNEYAKYAVSKSADHELYPNYIYFSMQDSNVYADYFLKFDFERGEVTRITLGSVLP